MGQSQLLMIILGVIIVGIAIAVGIGQFGESALAANRDAIAADGNRIIAQSQTWYRKPTSLGGGGNTFTGLTLGGLGVNGTNSNGTCALSSVAAQALTVLCTGTENTSGGSAVQVTLVYTASNDSTAYSDNM